MDDAAISGFDWDDGNRAKCQKHGVAIADIEAAFSHPHHLAPDVAHSSAETRYLAIGRGAGVRPMFVIFTLRTIKGDRFIRPISARYMHRKEIDHYEQATSRADQ